MRTSVLTIALLFSLSALAQKKSSIKGLVRDTVEKSNLKNAAVMVLNAKDSVLTAFTFTKNEGSFALDNIPVGKYIITISYPDYADYSERFELDLNLSEIDFGIVNLSPKMRLLKEVIIKAKASAVKMNRDTITFNARAYVIQPNDRVEDLIRQFPGIQIDRDGRITVQGKTVSKVLLDGEEFFGDDPTLITRNIRADMVDKVQVYDKKSDQASFRQF
ncbi:MAG: outer rane beta-barrel protein [Mucilaginibacter sp.]|nr:outer rane beta-barrel protein [Mucilaginibacter sp.]